MRRIIFVWILCAAVIQGNCDAEQIPATSEQKAEISVEAAGNSGNAFSEIESMEISAVSQGAAGGGYKEWGTENLDPVNASEWSTMGQDETAFFALE